MMFVKVQAEGPARSEILRTVEIFRCKVVDVSSSEMTIEATGDHDKLDAILSLLHRFGIKRIAICNLGSTCKQWAYERCPIHKVFFRVSTKLR